MSTNLITIGDVELSPAETAMFITMLDDPDHTHAPEEVPDKAGRAALDMLVLEGIIERFRTDAGDWLNAWVITDEAIRWTQDPEVGADIQLSIRLLRVASSPDIHLTT